MVIDMGRIKDRIGRYDEKYGFLRQCTIPEEDRARYTSAKWDGGYRWFRSPNVVCLEKYRRVKGEEGPPS
jgi:hypothetical protein